MRNHEGSRFYLTVFFALMITSMVSVSALAANISRGPSIQPDSQKDPIMESGILITAELQDAVAGPVAQSYPPIYTHQLKFQVKQVFRGDLESEQVLTGNHQARQLQKPVFVERKLYLVAISKVRDEFNVDFIQEPTEALLNKASLAGKLPTGWMGSGDQVVSPWAQMGPKFWPENAKIQVKEDSIKCSKTGRPALFAGKDIEFTVKPVPPVEEIKWTNPDGDGLYEVTVTNKSSEKQVVPALLSDGKKILRNESIAILCQNKAQPAPFCSKSIPETVECLTLEPDQSVSGQINAFGLKNIDWPRGGYRIEFQFCLGEKSVKQSFYYKSDHHDKIRQQVLNPVVSNSMENAIVQADYTLRIKFLSDLPVLLDKNAKVEVVVYGSSKLVADAPATIIKTQTVPLKSLEDPVVISFSKEQLKTVTPRANRENEFRYYFRFKLDANGDDQTGVGDYSWDFQKTNMLFFDENQTGLQDIQIYLKEVK